MNENKYHSEHDMRMEIRFNESNFIKAIQRSRFGLKEYTLNQIKLRIQLEDKPLRQVFGVTKDCPKLVLNSHIPFGKIQYSVKKTKFNLVYIPKGRTCQVYQIPNNLRPPYGSSEFTMPDDLFISESDVTVDLWLKVMGAYPNGYLLEMAKMLFKNYRDIQNPITAMTLSEAKEFCNRLSVLCGLKPCYPNSYMVNPNFDEVSPIRRYDFVDISANGFRLPTLLEYLHVAKVGYTVKDYIDYVIKNCDKLKTKKCIHLTGQYTGYGGASVERMTQDDIYQLFEVIINVETISNSTTSFSRQNMFAFCFNGISPQVLCSLLDQIDSNDLCYSKNYMGEITCDLDFGTALSNMKFKEKIIDIVNEYEWTRGGARNELQPTKLKKPNAWGIYDATSNVMKLTQDSKETVNKQPTIHVPQKITYFDYLKEEYGTKINIRYGNFGVKEEDISSESKRVLKNASNHYDMENALLFGETSRIDLYVSSQPRMFLNYESYGYAPHLPSLETLTLRYSGFKIIKQVPKNPKDVPY